MDKIDFVITWVDGNDANWQNEKSKYDVNANADSRNIRYREWGILKYWFRGVEKFAPWVNKIYFVTYGHLPEWLDVTNPKLVIVNHKDFIPEQYLPTFNSNAIELNLHRIKGLSEQFVYFNDDMFIINKTKSEDFFKNGKPCDMAVFRPITNIDETFISIQNNVMMLLNRNFKFDQIKKKNLFKYIHYSYGKDNLMTLLCLPWHRLLGFKETHHANPFLKSTCKKLWEKEYMSLDLTCKNKFRTPYDLTQYIFKYWQFCEGNFIPKNGNKRAYRIFENLDRICDEIEKQKRKFICVNDSNSDENFEVAQKRIIESFEKLLPEKSKFEK